MKMPAFQFYPADWRKDPGVQALDYQDRGIWFEILCILHESDERGVLLLNGRPMPEPALARLLGLDNQILTTTLTNLVTYGVASRRESDGALYSRRMVKDEALCQIRREAGKKGGNPSLVKQKPTTGDNQVLTPSSSSSTSSTKTACQQSDEQAGGQGSTSSSESSTKQPQDTKGGAAKLPRPIEYTYDEAPIFQSASFFAYLTEIGYPQVDKGLYLVQIQSVGRERMITTTNDKWKAFIKTFLNNDRRDSKLLLPPDAMGGTVAPRNNFTPPPTPKTTGYSIAAMVAENKTNLYL